MQVVHPVPSSAAAPTWLRFPSDCNIYFTRGQRSSEDAHTRSGEYREHETCNKGFDVRAKSRTHFQLRERNSANVRGQPQPKADLFLFLIQPPPPQQTGHLWRLNKKLFVLFYILKLFRGHFHVNKLLFPHICLSKGSLEVGPFLGNILLCARICVVCIE